MLKAIRYHFSHLFDFTGRDARQTFWYWVLFVVVLNIVVSLAISVPVTVGAMSDALATAGTDRGAADAAMVERMAAMAGPLVWASIVLGIVNIVLLAASFVRRLHDSGKSALWAVVAGAVQLVVLFMALGQVGNAEAMIRDAAAARSAEEAFGLRGAMAWQSLLGWVPLIILIVFGVMKSDGGANAYGEQPVRF